MGSVSQSEICSTSFEASAPEAVVSPKKLADAEPDATAADEQGTPAKRRRRRRQSLLLIESSSEEDADISLRRRRKGAVNYYESDSCSEGEDAWESSSPAFGWKANIQKPSLPQGVIRGCAECGTCQKVVARWRPDAGHQFSLAEAPCFYPSEEEFKDTLKYLASIRSEAEQYGIVRIVPPPSWRPPCRLREGDAQNLLFPTRVQKIHQLQCRDPAIKKCSPLPAKHPAARKKRKSKYGSVGRCKKNPQALPMGRMKGDVAGAAEHSDFFGFEPGASFRLKEFESYANDFKSQYFERQEPESKSQLGCNLGSKWDPPSDAIEGEYWRIVENATEQIEVLYGADVETASYCSGFPIRKTGPESVSVDPYSTSTWNLNNIARSAGSILAFEEGNISGVQVPWLYVGMCFSSFCWHVEDHHFYSLNYMHFGEPKIWYGVPGNAAQKLEEVMKKRLPELFAEQPDLLHKLVTQLSPAILREEGVPVFKVKQRPGEFVVTLPRAYHSGFNCGFNCAEAVNVAPVDWLPHGQSAVELYRRQLRKTSVSHDKLLIAAAWHAVKTQWGAAARPEDKAKHSSNPWKESCGPSSVLAKALKARVEMERKRQASLRGDVLIRQMDQLFDATEERECFHCHYDLHLSAVGCSCCPEKYSCLEHTTQLCSCPWGSKFVLCRVDLASLEMLLAAVEGKPNYVMAVITWQKMQEEMRLKVSSQKALSPPNSFPPDDHPPPMNPPKTPALNVPDGSLSKENGHSVTSVRHQIDEFFSEHEARLREQAAARREGLKNQSCGLNREADDCKRSPAEGRLPSGMLGSSVKVAGNAGVWEPHTVSAPSEVGGGNMQAHSSDSRSRFSTDPSTLMVSALVSRSNSPNQPVTQYVPKPTVPVAEGWLQHQMQNNIPKPDQVVGRVSVSHLFSDSVRVDRMGGPRVAKVVRAKRALPDAELLNVGTLVLRAGYHDRSSIFPAGFKSRRPFPSLVNPAETALYDSEILEAVTGPIFQVTLVGSAVEPFNSSTIDLCWQQVQEKLNGVIMQQRRLGRASLPPLQPAGSVHGREMFGFNSPSILQAVEALDPGHQCSEYWSEKLKRPQEGVWRPGANGAKMVILGESADKGSPMQSVNTSSSVGSVYLEVGEPQQVQTEGLQNNGGGQQDTEVLKALFKKVTADELQALLRLLKRVNEGADWSCIHQSLVESLDTSRL